MQQVRADEIKRALSKRHMKDVFLTEVKTGRTWNALPGELQRIDALAIKRSWTQPCITAYEVKVSRSDFMSDDKWRRYRDYCHRLYFACPSGLIQPEELAEDIGLIWFKPGTGALTTRKAALFRDIEIPAAMFYHLIISRTESDRHPFFSNQRELLEAWVADKAARGELAYRVSAKIAALESMREKLDVVTEKKEELQKTLDGINSVLGKHGLPDIRDEFALRWRLKDLEQALIAKLPAQAVRLIRQVAEGAQMLEKMIEPGEERMEANE